MKKARLQQDINDIQYHRAVKKISRFLNNWIYLIVATITLSTYIGIEISNWNYTYFDADGYMRAIRLYHWILNPSFFEQPLIESNYPFGEILHWTRPFDIVWLICSLPFSHLNNLKNTIFLGGSLTGPILFVLSAITLVYGLRRRFNIYIVLLGYCIFLSDPITQSYFSYSRPDHHSLMAMLGIYSVSLILCWLKKRHLRYLRLLGFSLALATFTAIEGIIIYLLFMGFFLILYTFKNISLNIAVKTAKYYAISLTLFLLLNPPYQGLFYPDNGRISILYITFAWLLFGVLYGLELSHLHTRLLKILSLICSALGICITLLLCFGADIFKHPLDNEIYNIWANRIFEMQTLWQTPLYYAIATYAFAGLSLLLSFWLLRNKTYNRLMIFNLSIGIPLFVLNIFAHRFANYQCLYNIIPWLCLIDWQYKKSPFAKHRSNEFPPKIWLSILLILLCQQLTFMPYSIFSPQSSTAETFSPLLCKKIQNIGGTLLTDNFISPKYIWHCNVNTVGTPYHRNHEGLKDNHAILTSQNDGEIIPLLLKHQVTQILLFNNYDKKYYDMSPNNSKKLYYRLLKGENIPSFLTETPSIIPNIKHYQLNI